MLMYINTKLFMYIMVEILELSPSYPLVCQLI